MGNEAISFESTEEEEKECSSHPPVKSVYVLLHDKKCHNVLIGRKRIVYRTRATDKKDSVFRLHHQAGQWVAIGGKMDEMDEDYIGTAQREFKEETGLDLCKVALSFSIFDTMHEAYVLIMAKIKPEHTLKKISKMINNNLVNVNHYLSKEGYLHQELAKTKVVSYRYIHSFLGQFNSKKFSNNTYYNTKFIKKTYYLSLKNKTYIEEKPTGKFRTSYNYIPQWKEDMVFQEKLRKHDTDLMYNFLQNQKREKSLFHMQNLLYHRNHETQDIT